MTKVSIRVYSGAAYFDVAVQAESVEQALGFVSGCYRASDVRVESMTNALDFSGDYRPAPTVAGGLSYGAALAA